MHELTKAPEIILPDDPRAATYSEKIKGWIARTGEIYPIDKKISSNPKIAAEFAELWARQRGATHNKCSTCEAAIEKGNYCGPCHEQKQIDRYNALEECYWDGENYLYSEAVDKFFDLDELSDYLDDEQCSIESLRLVICSQVYLSQIEDDYWQDELPGDGEAPEVVLDALKKLNEVIAAQPPIGWHPGKLRADVKSIEARTLTNVSL